MYIEKLMLPRQRYNTLLEAIKIHPEEDLKDNRAVCLKGVLTIYHDSYAKMVHKPVKDVLTIVKDFEVIKIYGADPSYYDQQLYRNVMSKIYEKEGYKEESKKHRIKNIKNDEENINE